MVTNRDIANLIFPDIQETIDDLEKRFPKRQLKDGAEVTRFAPSPTGFLHTGSLFTSLICYKVAKQTGGIFYIRLEDTDQKREIEGSGLSLINQLKTFGIVPDEGYLGDIEKGNYGPYTQSKRASIYNVVIKHLIEIGRAYPCFCSQEELNEIRAYQEKNKITTGYYGEYAKSRFLSNEEGYELIKSGKPFVIRFKSEGNHLNKIKVSDLVHGDFEIAQNDQDIVIFKSDGLPTYHFAHAVDDHFMRTTTVIRGEEWIASLPIHVELFEALGWQAPKYAHLPVIMKTDDNGNKRKLSKRLDKEAAVSYFIDDGYLPQSLIMYLMTIANSNFEEWIFAQKFENMDDFIFSFEKMSLEGALFDIGKLNFFARELFSKLHKEQVYELGLAYAKEHDKRLLNIIQKDPSYFKEIMNIEREKENPRKDYEKFGDVYDKISFFYEDEYNEFVKNGLTFNEKFDFKFIAEILSQLKEKLSLDNDEQTWFSQMKEVALSLGFATDRKLYKANPDQYKGMVGDVAEILRIAITTRKQSPNLFIVMQILTIKECHRRIDLVISQLTK